MLKAARRAGVRRLFVVGGAGNLEVAPAVRLIDTPEFPEIYKNEALAHCALLKVIRAEADDLDWTYRWRRQPRPTATLRSPAERQRPGTLVSARPRCGSGQCRCAASY